ncbi:MAG: lysophospholipid acyltransferase family protein, partial [FCB group bacterium]|nr:lysophospholipid acyltransferase family protein [FCB group bacterium]
KECCDARGAVRGVFKAMKRGGTVLWLSDQDAGRDGIKVDFFGYPASTPRGAAAFSVKLKVPVVFGVLVREKGPYQKLILFPPIYPDSDIPREEAERKITQEYTDRLKDMIQRHPEMYWWAHRRWKSTGLYRKKKKKKESNEK